MSLCITTLKYQKKMMKESKKYPVELDNYECSLIKELKEDKASDPKEKPNCDIWNEE